MNTSIEYYKNHGPYSDPGDRKALPQGGGADIAQLVRITQANMIHAHWLTRYGLNIAEERRQKEMNLRTFHERVANMVELAGCVSAGEVHAKEKRSIGTCRDFTLMLCALLRDRGVPARELCGFGTYFMPGKFEDHWICEWFNEKENRWVLTDPQIDALQKEILGIDFDTLDMPRERFVTGARAWLMCRDEKYDPSLFGIFEFKGMDFIKGNLIRHFAALNKVPLLPWDCWGLIEAGYDNMIAGDIALLDEAARLAEDPDKNFRRIRTMYADDAGLRMNGRVTSYTQCGPVQSDCTAA